MKQYALLLTIALLTTTLWSQKNSHCNFENRIVPNQKNLTVSTIPKVYKTEEIPVEGTFFDGAEDHPSFEINSTYNGWSFIDGDNAPTYGFNDISFPGMGSQMAYIIFEPNETIPPLIDDYQLPHSGNKYFGFFCSINDENNDWLISPLLSNPIKLSFWAKEFMQCYCTAKMRVAYSTSGKEETDFVFISHDPFEAVVPTRWSYYEFDIPQEAKYVAINCILALGILMVDDITIEQIELQHDCPAISSLTATQYNNNILLEWTEPKTDLQIEGYNIFRNDELLTEDLITETTFLDENLLDEVYDYYVSTYYANGCVSDSSNHVTVKIEDAGIEHININSDIEFYQTKNELIIDNEELKIKNVEIYNMTGGLVLESNNLKSSSVTIDISHLSKGIYFVQIKTEKNIINLKIIKY
jgi:hypothetical protein